MNVIKELEDNYILLTKNIPALRDTKIKNINLQKPLENLENIILYISNINDIILKNEINDDKINNIYEILTVNPLFDKTKIIENSKILKRQIKLILNKHKELSELQYQLLKNIIINMKYFDSLELNTLLNEHILDAEQVKIPKNIHPIGLMISLAPSRVDSIENTTIYDITIPKLDEKSTFYIEYDINPLIYNINKENTWDSGINKSIIEQYDNINHNIFTKKINNKFKTSKPDTETCVRSHLYVNTIGSNIKKYNLQGKTVYPFIGMTDTLNEYITNLNNLVMNELNYDITSDPPIGEREISLDKVSTIYSKLLETITNKLNKMNQSELPLNYNEFLELIKNTTTIKYTLEPIIFNLYESYIKNANIKIKYIKIVEQEIQLAVIETINELIWSIPKRLADNLKNNLLPNTFNTGPSERIKLLTIAYESTLKSALSSIKFNYNDKLILIKNYYSK